MTIFSTASGALGVVPFSDIYIYIVLLGFEQAWTPILNLTAPLCKLLALRDLSAYLGHHQFWAKSARQAIPGKRLKAAISLLGKGSIYPAFL